jgi:hypothetical protein
MFKRGRFRSRKKPGESSHTMCFRNRKGHEDEGVQQEELYNIQFRVESRLRTMSSGVGRVF